MAIPQSGEIPPAPPPPPKRASPVQGRLKRTQNQMQKLTAKTKQCLVKIRQLFFIIMGFLTGFFQRFIAKFKGWMNSYLGNIMGFGLSTSIAILIFCTYSNGSSGIFSFLEGNSSKYSDIQLLFNTTVVNR